MMNDEFFFLKHRLPQNIIFVKVKFFTFIELILGNEKTINDEENY
jgi:hypothetical protein